MGLIHAAAAAADPAPQDLSQGWERVKARLSATLGESVFRSWVRPLTPEGLEDGRMLLTAPTRFMRDWVLSHYYDDLLRYWRMEDPAIHQVEVLVRRQPAAAAASASAHRPRPEPGARGAYPESAAAHAEQAEGETRGGVIYTSFSAPLDPRFTFENFIVGKPNALAHAAARRVADSAEPAAGCNPLFLYGGVGLGKTHLMHAIAWQIRRNHPGRRVLYMSAEKFMYQFIRALRSKEAIAFKEQFRSVDVLMIDDVQFIAGKDSTQEEFFHTFNALVDQNKQLVISADRSPSDLDGIEERIRSRLGWGLVADIHATDYELRLGILQAKLEKMPGAEVPGKVLEFLAHKITSNIRELEGALNRVAAHATLVGQPVTLDTVQSVLHDLLRANDRRVTVEDIQKQVAAHYNIKLADMHSARRSRAIARPRQVAMYLAKKLTTRSLPDIGRKFGGKDHTTVMHAVKRIDELMLSDKELREDVELLLRMVQSA